LRIIGIEGTALSGKSTLCKTLVALEPSRFVLVPCFMDWVLPGIEAPPIEPESKEAELAAIRFFTAIERERMTRLPKAVDDNAVILVDRTIETLVAHVFALHVWDRQFEDECWNMICLETADCAKPELTIHLAAEPSLIQARKKSHPDAPPLFGDANFISAFNRYFVTERRAAWPCSQVSADEDPGMLATVFLNAIKQ